MIKIALPPSFSHWAAGVDLGPVVDLHDLPEPLGKVTRIFF